MRRKIRKLIKTYPLFSSLIIIGLIALALEAIGADSLAHALLFVVVAIALVPALKDMDRILRHGFYGINLLPVIGLLFALFLRHYWAAVALALIIAGEKPLLRLLRRKHESEAVPGKSVTLSSINHAPFVRFLDRYSVVFTIFILLVGGAVWASSGNTERFLEVIATASPAAFLLAPIAAFAAGLNRTREYGISVKSATLFEKLANSNSIVLSRKGILVSQSNKVRDIKPLAGFNKNDVLQTAAALAVNSEHSLSRAIMDASSKIKISKAKHARETPGLGVAGRQRGDNIYIGSFAFMKQSGVDMPDNFTEPAETAVYTAKNKKLMGLITFDEALLPGAKSLVARLKKLGIRSVGLVSSGSSGPVSATAKQVGIKTYRSDCSAADKIHFVENTAPKPVVFVGDAESDTASLTAADVSISYGVSANSSADIVIQDYTVDKIINVLAVSRQTLMRAKAATLLGLSVTFAFTALAASGRLTPLTGAILQIITVLMTLLIAGRVSVSQTKK